MKVLVLGNGGREHALALKFLEAGHITFCCPGNGGTHSCCEPLPASVPSLNLTDVSSMVALAKFLEAELVVIGPEQPLALGAADALCDAGFRVFGPKRAAARLESSKAFAKTFMDKYKIPTGKFINTTNPQQAQTAAARFCQNGDGVVIKPSGLTAGKGVTVCQEYQQACRAIDEMIQHSLYGKAGHEVVVEERLTGPEISVLALCDGKNMVPLIPAQDHKAIFENDEGPNTGGMGAYAPTPFATGEMMRRIEATVIEPTLRGIQQEGLPFQGVLYFGLMLTPTGPKVLEFNTRFGDPETQTILPLLDEDLAEVMIRCTQGTLNQASIRWRPKVAACVVLASKGYPGDYPKGKKITGLEFLKERQDVAVFHAGTTLHENGEIFTSGGRVLGVTGVGDDLEAALHHAYEAVDVIDFEGKTVRRDIGRKALSALSTCV